MAVNICALIVLGSSAPPGGLALSFVSRCMDEEELKEAEEEEELHAAPEINGDIAVNVKMHDGWKMSYRLQQPEEKPQAL